MKVKASRASGVRVSGERGEAGPEVGHEHIWTLEESFLSSPLPCQVHGFITGSASQERVLGREVSTQRVCTFQRLESMIALTVNSHSSLFFSLL